MEGMNVGAILLEFLGILIAGLLTMVAFGFLLARKLKNARLTLATGLLASAVLAALAAFSFLSDGRSFGSRGTESIYLMRATSLLLAGVGQFLAALRVPSLYLASLGLALMAVALLLFAIPATDPFSHNPYLSMPGISVSTAMLARTVSLFTGLLSLGVAVIPRAAEKKPLERDGKLG